MSLDFFPSLFMALMPRSLSYEAAIKVLITLQIENNVLTIGILCTAPLLTEWTGQTDTPCLIGD